MVTTKRIKKLVAEGFDSIVDSFVSPRDYVRPSQYGFYLDQQNLVRDVRNLGNDMKKAIALHGKQPYERPGH